MTVIDGAGHFPHLEKPDELNKHILAWIARETRLVATADPTPARMPAELRPFTN
jgi:hypothetical protein